MSSFPFAKAVPFLLLVPSALVYAEDASPAAASAGTAVAKAESAKKPARDPNDISAEEIAGLLRQLRSMRDGLDSEERRTVTEALKALAPASASPNEAVSLWSGSVRALEFDKQNKRGSDFDDWRKKNDDKLHDAGFAAAMRLQCRYLKLCLEADTPEKAGRAGAAIIALMEESIKAMPQCAQYASVLREDVFSSPIAKRFGVEKQCPEGWARAPLSIDANFGRFVKAALAKNPADVPALWESRMKLERAQAEATDQIGRVQRRHRNSEAMGRRINAQKDEQDTKAVDVFERDKLPGLLWSMGEDFYKAGLRRRGIETLFGVLRKYPKHASYSGWVDRITAMAESIESEKKASDTATAPTTESTATVTPSAATAPTSA